MLTGANNETCTAIDGVGVRNIRHEGQFGTHTAPPMAIIEILLLKPGFQQHAYVPPIFRTHCHPKITKVSFNRGGQETVTSYLSRLQTAVQCVFGMWGRIERLIVNDHISGLFWIATVCELGVRKCR